MAPNTRSSTKRRAVTPRRVARLPPVRNSIPATPPTQPAAPPAAPSDAPLPPRQTTAITTGHAPLEPLRRSQRLRSSAVSTPSTVPLSPESEEPQSPPAYSPLPAPEPVLSSPPRIDSRDKGKGVDRGYASASPAASPYERPSRVPLRHLVEEEYAERFGVALPSADEDDEEDPSRTMDTGYKYVYPPPNPRPGWLREMRIYIREDDARLQHALENTELEATQDLVSAVLLSAEAAEVKKGWETFLARLQDVLGDEEMVRLDTLARTRVLPEEQVDDYEEDCYEDGFMASQLDCAMYGVEELQEQQMGQDGYRPSDTLSYAGPSSPTLPTSPLLQAETRAKRRRAVLEDDLPHTPVGLKRRRLHGSYSDESEEDTQAVDATPAFDDSRRSRPVYGPGTPFSRVDPESLLDDSPDGEAEGSHERSPRTPTSSYPGELMYPGSNDSCWLPDHLRRQHTPPSPRRERASMNSPRAYAERLIDEVSSELQQLGDVVDRAAAVDAEADSREELEMEVSQVEEALADYSDAEVSGENAATGSAVSDGQAPEREEERDLRDIYGEIGGGGVNPCTPAPESISCARRELAMRLPPWRSASEDRELRRELQLNCTPPVHDFSGKMLERGKPQWPPFLPYKHRSPPIS